MLTLMLVCLAGICHAQDNRVFIPPDIGEVRTHTFTVPELQIDSAFIDSLNDILFDKKCSAVNLSPEDKPWRNFFLFFIKKDSLNYTICLSLEYHPGRKARGFFERDGYWYFLYGSPPPPHIVLGTKSEKQFSFTSRLELLESIFWDLTYNCQTKAIKVKRRPCN